MAARSDVGPTGHPGPADEEDRAGEALRRLEKALETMQIGVTITDLDGRITYVNPADARMHGYRVDELLGQDVGVYAPPGRRRPLSVAQLKELSSRSRQSLNAHRDGRLFPVHLRSDVVVNLAGEPIGVVTTCEDITDRKGDEDRLQRAYEELRQSHLELHAAQLQLIQAEKLDTVGRMAAGVAHEVKNPLMTILTGAKYLSKRLAGADERAQSVVVDVTNAVYRADKIIRGLLDFAAAKEVDRTACDLAALVDQALLLVKHDLDAGRIVVERQFAPELPRLQLDTFKIQQMLVNLFTNARQAMPEGGTVTVRAYTTTLEIGERVGYRKTDRFVPDEPAVILTVDDTGPGVPKEHLTKVFDPFFTTKPSGVGTGLGLAVSRHIVEMHGGTIDLANRDGGGLRVTITFRVDAVG